jgi:hypothetical protein
LIFQTETRDVGGTAGPSAAAEKIATGAGVLRPTVRWEFSHRGSQETRLAN